MLDLGQEAHFKFPCGLVNLKELFEAFLEDWVAKRVSHDIVSTSGIKAWLHFKDSYLIKSCNKQIYNNASFLGTSSQILIILDRLLEMLGIVLFLLDVEMGANLFLEGLRNNHTWAISNRATDKCHNS
jgi:hypothetical protein